MIEPGKRMCQFEVIIIFTLVFLIIVPVMLGNIQKVYADNGNVTINATNFPDENFRSYVKDNFDSDKNGILYAEEIDWVSSIKVDNSNIYDLTGLEYFANLTQLICNDNQLTNLDISNNRRLEILNCASNHLTSLDLSNNDNLSLDSLMCSDQSAEVEAIPDDSDSKWSVDISFIKDYGERVSNLAASIGIISDSTVTFEADPEGASITYDYDTRYNEVQLPVTLKVVKHMHVYDQEIVNRETICMPPSCTSVGSYYKSCLCGAVSKSFDDLFFTDSMAHRINDEWMYDDEKHWHYCMRCRKHFDDVDHSFGDWIITAEPTYTTKGSRYRICSECGFTLVQEIQVIEQPTITVPDIVNLKAKTKGKTAETLTWTKVKGASGYEVYFANCSSSLKKIATTKSQSYVKKGLKKGTAYKFRIRAYKIVNGKKSYITSSYIAHAIAGGYSSKFTDAKAIKASKTSLTISTGKSAKVSAKQSKVKTGRRFLKSSHAALYRYKSSNPYVATVSSKGSVKGQKTGTCRIYIYAQNGLWTSVKVTVK